MGRRDKVDIVTPYLLEFEHHLRQFFVFAFFALAFVRDRPILAEDTAEVAVGEEDGSGSMLTHQRYFLSKMGMGAESDNLHGGPAEPFLTLLPVHSATPGTEVTTLEEGVGLVNPLFKFTLSLQLFISGNPWFFFFR
jgi:hypothetical protein